MPKSLQEYTVTMSKIEEMRIVLKRFRLLGFTLGMSAQMLGMGALIWFEYCAEEYSAPENSLAAIALFALTVVCCLATILWPLVWMTPFVLSMTSIGKWSKIH